MHLKEPQPPDPPPLSSHAYESSLTFLCTFPNCCVDGLRFVDVALTGPSSSPVTTIAHPSIEVAVSFISLSASVSLPSIVGPQVSYSSSPSLPSFFRFRHFSLSENFRFVMYPSPCGYWNLKLLNSLIDIMFDDCLLWGYSVAISKFPLLNSGSTKAFLSCPLLQVVDILTRNYAKYCPLGYDTWPWAQSYADSVTLPLSYACSWEVQMNNISPGFFVIDRKSLSTMSNFEMKLPFAFSLCPIFSCCKLKLLLVYFLCLSMVRGHKVSLWPKTSLLQHLFDSLVSCIYCHPLRYLWSLFAFTLFHTLLANFSFNLWRDRKLTMHHSIWFLYLLLFMFGFWLWLLLLLLIDLLRLYLIYSQLSAFITACFVKKCLSSFYVWLVPGLRKASVLWFSFHCVSGFPIAPSLVLFFGCRFFCSLFVLMVCSGYSALCSCCGVWKTVSSVFVITMVPVYCIDMVRFVLWLRLGLCVTGLLIFRQPQRPMVTPLVYDEECLRWGLLETCCILLIFFVQLCFKYSHDFLYLNSLRIVLLSCSTFCLSLSMVPLNLLSAPRFGRLLRLVHLFSGLFSHIAPLLFPFTLGLRPSRNCGLVPTCCLKVWNVLFSTELYAVGWAPLVGNWFWRWLFLPFLRLLLFLVAGGPFLVHHVAGRCFGLLSLGNCVLPVVFNLGSHYFLVFFLWSMMLTFLFMIGLRPLWLRCSSATGLCFFCIWFIVSFLGSFYFFVSGTVGVCTIFWFHWTLLLVSGIVLSKWEALLGFDHSSSMRKWNAVKRYALHFSPFYSSLSMVRGHKVQALCPVARPLNLMFGQHYTCIVNHMALNIILPAHAPMTLQATDSFSIIACPVLCKGLCQVFDDLVLMLLISSLLPSCFQLGQPLCTTTSWFFSINWICSLVSSVRNDAAYCIDALHFLEDSVIPRYLLSSPLTWLLPRSEELRQGIFADCVLQRTTLFSSLFFYILDCNVFVSF